MTEANVIDSEFGVRLRAIRKEAGITQSELVQRAAKHGVELSGQSALGKIERGERGVSFGEGVAIMRALGVWFDLFVDIDVEDAGEAIRVVPLADALERIELIARDALRGDR